MGLTYFIGRAHLEDTAAGDSSDGVVGPISVAGSSSEEATQHPGQGGLASSGQL